MRTGLLRNERRTQEKAVLSWLALFLTFILLSAAAFADDDADPNFPKPGGEVRVSIDTTIWWTYFEGRLFIEFRGPGTGSEMFHGSAYYYGFNDTGSYLSAVVNNSGSINIYTWKDHKLSLYKTYRNMPIGDPSPPPGLNTVQASSESGPESCDRSSRCSNAKVSLDAEQRYVLSYGASTTRPPRKVFVCLLAKKISLNDNAPAALREAERRAGAAPSSAPFQSGVGDAIFVIGDSLKKTAKAFRLYGSDLQWYPLTDNDVQVVKDYAGTSEPSCEARWHA